MTRLALLWGTLLLTACVEEPTPQEAEKAAINLEQDAVKERQLSIEEAAEEATKLIEADAKEEIDEFTVEPTAN
jgi:uncharacterized lipoprotein YajG